jgi:hypothetical protein
MQALEADIDAQQADGPSLGWWYDPPCRAQPPHPQVSEAKAAHPTEIKSIVIVSRPLHMEGQRTRRQPSLRRFKPDQVQRVVVC